MRDVWVAWLMRKGWFGGSVWKRRQAALGVSLGCEWGLHSCVRDVWLAGFIRESLCACLAPILRNDFLVAVSFLALDLRSSY